MFHRLFSLSGALFAALSVVLSAALAHLPQFATVGKVNTGFHAVGENHQTERFGLVFSFFLVCSISIFFLGSAVQAQRPSVLKPSEKAASGGTCC